MDYTSGPTPYEVLGLSGGGPDITQDEIKKVK
jgi:curved DNA-binding protein CbpA